MNWLLVRIETIDKYSAMCGKWLNYLASASVFGIVVLLVVASLRRYLQGAPFALTEELASLLFVATAFFALTNGLYANRHVRLSFVWERFSPRMRQQLDVVAGLLSLFVLFVVIYQTTNYAAFSYVLKARSENSGLLIWPWMALIPINLAILSFAIFLHTLSCLLRGLLGISEPSETGGH